MDHALDDLARRGFTEVVLWYAEENERAGLFYRAAGFEADPRADRTSFKDTGLHQRRLRRTLEGPAATDQPAERRRKGRESGHE